MKQVIGALEPSVAGCNLGQALPGQVVDSRVNLVPVTGWALRGAVTRRFRGADGVLGAMNFDLQPPVEAGGIRMGATRDEARDQCHAHGEPKPFRRSSEVTTSLVVQRPSGLSIFVYFDAADVVEAIEFGRPQGSDLVSFLGIDIFGTPADTLVEKLREHTSVDIDEDGHSATAPDLLLALWRAVVPEDDNDPDGRYFESVLIARPGYYEEAAVSGSAIGSGH